MKNNTDLAGVGLIVIDEKKKRHQLLALVLVCGGMALVVTSLLFAKRSDLSLSLRAFGLALATVGFVRALVKPHPAPSQKK